MKKKFILVLVVLMTLAMVLPASAATPAPGGPFSTAFRIQNLESSAAVTCDYTFYDAAGVAKFTSGQSPAINAGDSLFVYVPNISGLTSGSYSGVVGCTGKVAAVANFSDADSGASFNGVSAAGTTWYAPGIYDNYFNYYSSVVVQNATGSPVNITLDIFAAGSSTPVKSQTISGVQQYASVSFEQEGASELADNQPYSARITATGNVAPVVTVYGKGSANNQLYSYNPFQSGATTLYAPVVMKNYYGYNSALIVQNMGSAETTVTVNYSPGHSQSQAVAAGASWTIYVPGQAALPSGPAGLFSAVVSSTGGQPLALLVNESNAYNRAASYVGFSGGSGDVRTPVLEKRYVNYSSSVTCQMISGGPADITIQYFDTSGSLGTTTATGVGNGQTHLFLQPNTPYIPAGWIGSAKVTSSGQIACVVNQDMIDAPYATQSMDQLYAYEGVAP
jgi:hypothetical protein